MTAPGDAQRRDEYTGTPTQALWRCTACNAMASGSMEALSATAAAHQCPQVRPRVARDLDNPLMRLREAVRRMGGVYGGYLDPASQALLRTAREYLAAFDAAVAAMNEETN